MVENAQDATVAGCTLLWRAVFSGRKYEACEKHVASETKRVIGGFFLKCICLNSGRLCTRACRVCVGLSSASAEGMVLFVDFFSVSQRENVGVMLRCLLSSRDLEVERVDDVAFDSLLCVWSWAVRKWRTLLSGGHRHMCRMYAECGVLHVELNTSLAYGETKVDSCALLGIFLCFCWKVCPHVREVVLWSLLILSDDTKE